LILGSFRSERRNIERGRLAGPCRSCHEDDGGGLGTHLSNESQGSLVGGEAIQPQLGCAVVEKTHHHLLAKATGRVLTLESTGIPLNALWMRPS